MNAEELLFVLLRQSTEELPELLTEELLVSLFEVSKAQDMTHLVAYELDRRRLLGNDGIAKKFRNAMLLAMWRVEKINHEYAQLTEVFEKEGIPYVPLKGAVIRPLYPEPWLRTSCDIDILVKEEDLDRAVNALTDSRDYRAEKRRSFHDIILHAPSGVHLELHFSLRERMEKPDKLLERVWDHCSPREEGAYCFLQSREFLMFHIVAHMAYHFLRGGCGIKSFLDLYCMEKALDYDKEVLLQLLNEAGLWTFYSRMKEVMAVWAYGEAHTEITRRIADYILAGQTFGTNANRVAMEQNGSKGKQALTRIFLPTPLLCDIYPSLRKRLYLMPLYQVARWLRVIKNRRFRPALRELTMIRRMDEDRRMLVAQILKDVGL